MRKDEGMRGGEGPAMHSRSRQDDIETLVAMTAADGCERPAPQDTCRSQTARKQVEHRRKNRCAPGRKRTCKSMQDHVRTCRNKSCYISGLLFRTYLIRCRHQHHLPNTPRRYPMHSTSRLCTTPKSSKPTMMQIMMEPRYLYARLLWMLFCLFRPKLRVKSLNKLPESAYEPSE